MGWGVGCIVGSNDGAELGTPAGTKVGTNVDTKVGTKVGTSLGANESKTEGSVESTSEGASDGNGVEGLDEGNGADGLEEGMTNMDGDEEGKNVGPNVGPVVAGAEGAGAKVTGESVSSADTGASVTGATTGASVAAEGMEEDAILEGGVVAPEGDADAKELGGALPKADGTPVEGDADGTGKVGVAEGLEEGTSDGDAVNGANTNPNWPDEPVPLWVATTSPLTKTLKVHVSNDEPTCDATTK